MNRNIINQTKGNPKMPLVAKLILIGGLVISTVICVSAFIGVGSGGGDWLAAQNAVYIKRAIVEYYLVCVIESIFFGFAAHYLLK